MHDSNSIPANLPSILKRKSQHFLTRLFSDQFYTLHHTRDNNMFNPTVLALCVFSNQDCVDVFVGSVVSGDGTTGTDVGEEREGSSEGQV